jgi:hypothetical protein
MSICTNCKKEMQKITMFTSVEYNCDCQNQEEKLNCEYNTYFGNKTNYILVNLQWDDSIKQWKIVK